MLSLLLDLISGAALTRAAWVFANAIWTITRPPASEPSPVTTADVPITIVLPVYQEEASVAEACRYFGDMVREREASELIVCGTAKERSEDSNPTLAIAIEALRDYPRCRVLESPHVDGLKVDQVNFAIAGSGGADGQGYVAVFDVDSRPLPGVLDEFAAAARNGAPVIQQHALFTENLGDLSGRVLQLGQSIYQSRWTIAHEIPRFRLYRAGLSPFVHLVGHGLMVSRAMLHRFNGFPTGSLVEDAHIGFYATIEEARIQSIGSFDFSDNPRSWAETFRQLYGWSKGPLDVLTYARAYRELPGMRASPLRTIGAVAVAWWYWFQWAVTTPTIALLLVSAALGHLLAAAWLVTYMAELLVSTAYVMRRSGIGGSLLMHTLRAFAFASVCSVPAVAAVIDAVRRRKPPKYKSSHFAHAPAE